MEYEFEISLTKIDSLLEKEVPNFRKDLEELVIIVPKKAAKEEIDLKEGKNTQYIAILNFYEFLKTKQTSAFKELQDMIQDTKEKSVAKMTKNKGRREEKKERVKKLKDEGKFIDKAVYWEQKQKEHAEKKAEEAVNSQIKAEKLKVFKEERAAEKVQKKAEAKAAGRVKNWDPKLGNKNNRHKIRKDDGLAPQPKTFEKKPFVKREFGNNNGDNKFEQKRSFNGEVKTFNKSAAFDGNHPGGFKKTFENKPYVKKEMGSAIQMHPSWEAKKLMREREMNQDFSKKNACVEL